MTPHTRWHWHTTAPWVVIATACLLTHPAVGLDPSLDRATLSGLASPDFATRQNTTRRLLADTQLSDDDLARLYAQAVTPEQKHRLLNVALHHTLWRLRPEKPQRSGRGAIGIRHEGVDPLQFPELQQPALLVVETFPGFPGYAHLQPRDLILNIDNQPFPPDTPAQELTQHFVVQIQNHPAGTTVELTVLRAGKTIKVRCPLASLDALQMMYSNNHAIGPLYLGAWETVRQRLVAREPFQPPLVVPWPTGSNNPDTPPAP